jgi:hypothetical protein
MEVKHLFTRTPRFAVLVELHQQFWLIVGKPIIAFKWLQAT